MKVYFIIPSHTTPEEYFTKYKSKKDFYMSEGLAKRAFKNRYGGSNKYAIYSLDITGAVNMIDYKIAEVDKRIKI